MKKGNKALVDLDFVFLKCPNKKHRAETALCVNSGAFDGFIRPGCSCALEIYIEELRRAEKKRRKK